MRTLTLQGVVVDVSNRVQGNQVSYISLCPCVRVWRPCWFQPIRADPTSICTDCPYFCFSAKRVNIDSVGCRERETARPCAAQFTPSQLFCYGLSRISNIDSAVQGERTTLAPNKAADWTSPSQTHTQQVPFLPSPWLPPKTKKFKLFNRMALLWTTNKRGKPHSLLAFPPYIEITTRLKEKQRKRLTKTLRPGPWLRTVTPSHWPSLISSGSGGTNWFDRISNLIISTKTAAAAAAAHQRALGRENMTSSAFVIGLGVRVCVCERERKRV